jgi:hypothetical protein
MDGEDDETRERSMAGYEKLGSYLFAKNAKAVRDMAQKMAREQIAAAFEEFGIQPNDLKSLADWRRESVFSPMVEKLGPESRKFIPKATELMRKAAALGEELDADTAFILASRGKVKPSTPEPRRPTGFIPTAEGGPADRESTQPRKRTGPASDAEILASFKKNQESYVNRFGAMMGDRSRNGSR